MNWSPQQQKALDMVAAWLKNPGDEQVFRLFGFAGTGKTTLAKHLAATVDGQVLFAAYTGKAASVMRQAGCSNAATIHSLIYLAKEKSRWKFEELREKLQFEDNPAELQKLEKLLARERKRLKSPHWVLNLDSPLRDAALLVIDECSMVDDIMGNDLRSFGVPILVLGDPAQLPPIKGTGHFTRAEPHIVLTEIHRQARDNPIIDLATRVRRGEFLRPGQYGNSQIITMRQYDKDQHNPHVQVIVGRHKTRHWINAARRKRLGFDSLLPSVGERVVCLKNNHNIGLLNGTIWTVRGHDPMPSDAMAQIMTGMIYQLGNEDGAEVETEILVAPFMGRDVDPWEYKLADSFDFGYAMTCHKAQGSQWQEVLIVDESGCFRGDRMNWLYTAVTRAAEKLTIIQT